MYARIGRSIKSVLCLSVVSIIFCSLSVCLSVCQSVCLSACLSVCLSLLLPPPPSLPSPSSSYRGYLEATARQHAAHIGNDHPNGHLSAQDGVLEYKDVM